MDNCDLVCSENHRLCYREAVCSALSPTEAEPTVTEAGPTIMEAEPTVTEAGPTVAEGAEQPHHGHGDAAAVAAVEHPLLGQQGVKGHRPQALEVERVEQQQARIVRQRPRSQEPRDQT